MKRKPQKSQLPKPDPIIVEIDPAELRNKIVLPKISYKIVATMEEEQAFDGMILPIPKILIYYLTHSELLVVATILEEMTDNAECGLTVKELATRTRISIPTLSNALYSLRKIGLLLESPNGKPGAGRIRKINYKTLQYLNDLLEGENPGIFPRLRTATQKRTITSLTKEDVKKAYDNKVLEPGHDPAEEEEYD